MIKEKLTNNPQLLGVGVAKYLRVLLGALYFTCTN